MKQSYYGKLRAREYDIGTDQSEIVGFYLQHWEKLGKPEPLLELMSGTGLNMLPFFEAGVSCDGLDASEHMLAICQKKLDDQGYRNQLYEQLLEEMALPHQYGFMFIPGGSYGHIYDKQIAAECLRRIYASLLPGGWFVFDVRPLAYMDNFGKPGEVDYNLDEYDDRSTIFTTGFWNHLENGRVIQKWNKMERFVDDILTDTEVFDYRERLYDLDELQMELQQAGFDEIFITKAYEQNVEPNKQDGMVFSCHKA